MRFPTERMDDIVQREQGDGINVGTVRLGHCNACYNVNDIIAEVRVTVSDGSYRLWLYDMIWYLSRRSLWNKIEMYRQIRMKTKNHTVLIHSDKFNEKLFCYHSKRRFSSHYSNTIFVVVPNRIDFFIYETGTDIWYLNYN